MGQSPSQKTDQELVGEVLSGALGQRLCQTDTHCRRLREILRQALEETGVGRTTAARLEREKMPIGQDVERLFNQVQKGAMEGTVRGVVSENEPAEGRCRVGVRSSPQEPLQTADSLPGNDGEGNSVSSVHTSQIEHSEGTEGQARLGCDGEERLHRLSGSSLRRNGVTLPPHRPKSINDEGCESGN